MSTHCHLPCFSCNRDPAAWWQVLTPAQEAWLDCQCHPWAPDPWALAGLLAEQHPGEAPRAAETSLLTSGSPAVGCASDKDRAMDMALHMGAFGLLRSPLLGRGSGLTLRRECHSPAMQSDSCSTMPADELEQPVLLACMSSCLPLRST